MFKFTIRGTRGTIPVSGLHYQTYGGNTTCFSLHTPDGIIIFDSGTGIVEEANYIKNLNIKEPIHIFFTHFHIDHIMGFPCFTPVYSKKTKIIIHADSKREYEWKSTLRNFMAKPYWPIGLGEVAADISLKNLPKKNNQMHLYGCTIKWMNVPHPQGSLSYRIETPTQTIVIGTDLEYHPQNIQKEYIDFCKDADHLILDAQFTPDEYSKHNGWGHSCWTTCVNIAKSANAKHLLLTHHSPYRTNEEIDNIVADARMFFNNTSGARENMLLI